MLARGKQVSAAQQIKICLRVIVGYLLDYVLNTNHQVQNHLKGPWRCDQNG